MTTMYELAREAYAKQGIDTEAVIETLAARMAVSCSPAAVTGRMTKFGYMTAAKAESYLRAALRKELVLAYPQDPNKEADNEQ